MLFLDFDGVICDSVKECLVSSWLAYYREYKKNIPDSCPVRLLSDFYALRPFIRTGEDYLIVQDLLKNDFNAGNIKTQGDFDGIKERINPDLLDLYKKFLYKIRGEFLKKDREYFFSLNPLFRPVYNFLKKHYACKDLYIISTKKADVIAEILKYNNIIIPAERILYSGKSGKLDIIASIVGEKNAVFIDDQIDHLLENKDSRIEVYLAEWGYIDVNLPDTVKRIGFEGINKVFEEAL